MLVHKAGKNTEPEPEPLVPGNGEGSSTEGQGHFQLVGQRGRTGGKEREGGEAWFNFYRNSPSCRSEVVVPDDEVPLKG